MHQSYKGSTKKANKRPKDLSDKASPYKTQILNKKLMMKSLEAHLNKRKINSKSLWRLIMSKHRNFICTLKEKSPFHQQEIQINLTNGKESLRIA
jgi:hypothetical protein